MQRFPTAALALTTAATLTLALAPAAADPPIVRLPQSGWKPAGQEQPATFQRPPAVSALKPGDPGEPAASDFGPTPGSAARLGTPVAGGDAAAPATAGGPAGVLPQPQPTADDGAGRVTRVTKGAGTLPNEHGQVWREYDITPYTSHVTNHPKPQQAIVDWVLRETGTDIWFSDPFGCLSATKDKLRVYHTPEVQQIVADTVERFVRSEAKEQTIGIRLVTVGSPNWRSLAQHMLKPVSVQTPGVQAWLLTKEDAAVLVANLRKRTDFREHSSPSLSIPNGQAEIISRKKPRNYVRAIHVNPQRWPGHDMEMGQIQEGFSLELSPLASLQSGTIDTVIKCDVVQVEAVVPVWIDVPILGGKSQQVQIQVPQVSSWRLHERFRWTTDHVLLLSAGVVAPPDEGKAEGLTLPNLFATGPARADALLFLETKQIAPLTARR